MRPALWASSAGVLLAALGGCKVGPDFREPEVITPKAWVGLDQAANKPSEPSAESIDLSAWWTQLKDPTLTGLVERATQGNLTLAQAQSRLRQARAARAIAGAGIYPSVDAAASYTRSRDGGATRNLFRAGLDAGWEIDIFGGVRRVAEAADADAEAALYDLHAVRVSLAGEVANAYLDLRSAQRQREIARQNLAAQQQTLELTQERFEAGFVNALDVANARANVTQTAAQIPTYEARVRASIYALGVLLGHEPGALLEELSPDAPLPAAPAQIPVGLPSELLERRPDIRRARADLHAATARVGVAMADRYPRFFLNGSLGTQGSRGSSLATLADRFWSIGPSVSLPLLTGGRVEGSIEQAEAIAQEAMLAYRAAILTSLQDVETALVNFAREQERRAALDEAVAANTQAVGLALQLYSAGRTDFLNVLSAQRQLYAAQAALVQSQTDVAVNLVALYKALGGGWNVDAAAAWAGDSGTDPNSSPDFRSSPAQEAVILGP